MVQVLPTAKPYSLKMSSKGISSIVSLRVSAAESCPRRLWDNTPHYSQVHLRQTSSSLKAQSWDIVQLEQSVSFWKNMSISISVFSTTSSWEFVAIVQLLPQMLTEQIHRPNTVSVLHGTWRPLRNDPYSQGFSAAEEGNERCTNITMRPGALSGASWEKHLAWRDFKGGDSVSFWRWAESRPAEWRFRHIRREETVQCDELQKGMVTDSLVICLAGENWALRLER